MKCSVDCQYERAIQCFKTFFGIAFAKFKISTKFYITFPRKESWTSGTFYVICHVAVRVTPCEKNSSLKECTFSQANVIPK